MVSGLQDIGKTVFLTTHCMDELEHLADRVAIIVRGKIAVESSPQELTRIVKGSTVRFRLPAANPALLAGLPVSGAVDAPEVELRTEDPTGLLYAFTQRAHEQGSSLKTSPSPEQAWRTSSSTLSQALKEGTSDEDRRAGPATAQI